ncbi:hypothetical protein BTO02_05445 [Paraburkholderia sp. SOS3]|nr:hypothetical protein BTO02_05445 [Paraburkholderia sp. SOS3]
MVELASITRSGVDIARNAHGRSAEPCRTLAGKDEANQIQQRDAAKGSRIEHGLRNPENENEH